MRHQPINPETLGAPRGYANGVLAAPGRLLFVAGQIAWNADNELVSDAFAPQFKQALTNVIEVVKAAGGAPTDICRLTMYTTDKAAYQSSLSAVGQAYRCLMGKYFPAMALVEVTALMEDGALIEIEAAAVVPEAAKADEDTDISKGRQ